MYLYGRCILRVQNYCHSISLHEGYLNETCGLPHMWPFLNVTRNARERVGDYEKVKAGITC